MELLLLIQLTLIQPQPTRPVERDRASDERKELGDDLTKALDRLTHVAVVISAGKGATMQRGKEPPTSLKQGDILRMGDRLSGGERGIKILVLKDGHRERLLPRK